MLTGSNLELNGLLGYDAIVAGRFTGYGNLTFGLLSVWALLLTAAAATALGRRAGPDRAPARCRPRTVLGVGLLTVAVIGAPRPRPRLRRRARRAARVPAAGDAADARRG